MKILLKSLARPVLRWTLSRLEPLTGFWTDPTGYLPNRFKMVLGSYEKFLTAAIVQALPAQGVFVDVGANVGFISQKVARCRPQARGFSFEPNPRIYPTLQKNLKAYPRCQAVNAGLGAREGSLEFFHGAESCVGSFVQAYTSQHPANQSRGPIAKSQVKVTTGDTMLADIGTIDVMKMDVEGYEAEVLKGMTKLLTAGTIRTIFFEFCPFAQKWTHNPPGEIIHLLIKNGYAVVEVEGENHGAPVSSQNLATLVARLGDQGYTTLRADWQPRSQ